MLAWILFAMAVVTTACDKVPLFAPTGSSITLSADKLVAPLNSDVRITAVVQESAGTPPQNGTTVNFSSNLGTFEPAETQTVGGRVTVTFHTGGTSGVATIAATSGAAKADTGTGALKITIGAAAGKSVIVTASPSTVKSSGGSSEVTAAVLDESGNKLTGIPVIFSADNGTLSATQVQTDGNGEARTTLTTTKTAKVTATSGSLTKEVTITVATAPKGTVTAAPATINAGQATAITVTPDAGNAGTTSVALDFGDGSTQNLGSVTGAKAVSHTYTTAGTYTVAATFTDGNGDTANASTSVTVGQRKVATVAMTASTNNVAMGNPITFTITPTVPDGALPIANIRFDAGDGTTRDLGAVTTGQAVSVVHTYTTAGTYQAKATVSDTGGFSNVATQFITVGPRGPVVVTIAQPSSTPRNSPITFTATVTPPTGSTAVLQKIDWDFGDSTSVTTTGLTASKVYTSANTYTVKATATLTDGSTGTAQVQIVVP